ncbi:MAG: RHS repeat-associated core domain-containing protein [Flavobacteriales bacterium]
MEELLGEGKAKSGSNGVPFYYLPPEHSTTLKEVTYYLHDHLGNMRLTYSIPCVDGTPVPTLLHAADYYPYGSILRQHINGAQEKYLTTHHERDLETGLDYRGARYYDSDVARFLSLDPLAAEYASWSPYNYVLGNPVTYTDPTGRSAHSEVTKNEDGTFTLQKAVADDDRNIYVVDECGERTGEIIGQTLTKHSFINDDGTAQKGAIIDPKDQSGNNFFQKEIVNADLTVAEYMWNALPGQSLDFKRRGLANDRPSQLMHHIARGMPFDAGKSFAADGTRVQTFASARDIGNYAAGYVAGFNGIDWPSARGAFDSLESLQKFRIAFEAKPTVQSELRGFTHGFDIRHGYNTRH